MTTYFSLANKGTLLPLAEFAGETAAKYTRDPKARELQLTERINLNRALVDTGLNGPLAQSAAILMSTNPTATDTLVIGGDTYEFQAAAADLADDTFIAVEIGGSAAATLTNLIAAINGTADAAHATIFQTDSTTPALGRGTTQVVASTAGGILYIAYSKAQGESVSSYTLLDWATLPATLPSIALTDTLTAAGAVWSVANMNLLHWFNPLYSSRSFVAYKHVITAADITAGIVRVLTGIEDTDPTVIVQGYTTAGVVKAGVADTVVWNDTFNSVDITLPGGGTDWAATDVLHVLVVGTWNSAL
jgi:hypothetical protein